MGAPWANVRGWRLGVRSAWLLFGWLVVLALMVAGLVAVVWWLREYVLVPLPYKDPEAEGVAGWLGRWVVAPGGSWQVATEWSQVTSG